ncbi:death domain-containing protein 1-like [Liolophura sinensis]|uniref:death domain-containing protein 1-like n=1 Tax=Liolophura sinensis TaxID=3198878 RepID=UPI0031583644
MAERSEVSSNTVLSSKSTSDTVQPSKSRSNTVQTSKSRSDTKVETDTRTGAGVNRLSETTQKVSLKEGSSSQTKIASKSSTPKTGKIRSQSGGKSGTKKSTNNTKRPGKVSSKGNLSRETSSASRQTDPGKEKENVADRKEEEPTETGVKREPTQSSLAIAAVSQENSSEENGKSTQEPKAEGVDEEEAFKNDGTSLVNENQEMQKGSDSPDEAVQKEVVEKKKKFDIREFTERMGELSAKFLEDKFTRIDDNYPVDELISLITEVNDAIDHYKKHTLAAQQQLETLRDRMQEVRENIHNSVQIRAFEVRKEREPTLEQKELAAKLAKINAEVAHANVELARLVKMAAETETLALEAVESAENAAEEAEQARAEIEWRERKEAERKIEEEKRIEEERKRKEHEQKLEAERVKKQEQEWKRREAVAAPVGGQEWDNWPTHVLEISGSPESDAIGCIVRGDPAHFDPGRVTCVYVNQLESSFVFEQNDELVSPILSLEPGDPEDSLQSTICVAIPFVATRSSMHSREPVIKIEMNGEWKDVLTREVSFDDYKEKRFAQAEISEFTTVAVVTRFKRDYVTLSKKTSKISFSADQRVSFMTPRSSFNNKELLMLQVQPVDSNSLNDLKNRDKSMNGLLNSSPLVTTKWKRTTFNNTVTITVPCPPNPAKAKKLAAVRAAKEAKMTQPVRNNPVPLDMQDEEPKKKRKPQKQLQSQQQQEQEEEMTVRRTETRWYMGIYGGSDDDENDNLYLFHQFPSGRWAHIPDVNIQNVKLDVLQFQLDHPVERFVILRTRTNVDEEMAQHMVTTLEAALAMRTVQVILKQRSDDPFQAIAEVVTSSRVERTVNQLEEDGYKEGPDRSPDVTVCEGDIIEIGFRGNIHHSRDVTLEIPFNSNMPDSIRFTLSEVDRYLQRNFPLFRGFVQFYRKHPIRKKHNSRSKYHQRPDEDEVPLEPEPVHYQRELLTELMVKIPKYHVRSNPVPATAKFKIVNKSDPVDEDLVRYLAESLGDEWFKLAHQLNICHSRIQAIIRNAQAQDQTEDFAKYQMIMTWLKRAPKASNKIDTLTTALVRSGRYDLADDLRLRQQKFQEMHKGREICT